MYKHLRYYTCLQIVLPVCEGVWFSWVESDFRVELDFDLELVWGWDVFAVLSVNLG